MPKHCFVPWCTNSSTKTPTKLFVSVPRGELRKKWITAAHREGDRLSLLSGLFCCEDHFNFEEDMKNYIQYKLMGGRIYLKEHVVPHIFKVPVDQKPSKQLPKRKQDSTHSTCVETVSEPQPLETIVGPSEQFGLFGNICRTCLSEKPNMKSLFTTSSRLGGEPRQLFQMLMDYTSVQMEDDDGLPTQICLSCINHLARSLRFKQRCEDSDATLREALRKSTINDDQTGIELKPSLDVLLCAQETLADIDSDLLDIKMEFEEGESNIDDLISEDREKDNIKMMQNVDEWDSESTDTAYSEETTKPDITVDRMRERIHFETSTPVTKSKKSSDSIVHIDSLQNTTRNICHVCNKCFKQKRGLIVHVRTHTGDKPYVCNVCRKGYTTAGHMKAHLRIHTSKKPFKCHLCSKTFALGSTLKTHIKRHIGERDHVCVHCEKGFYEASQLKRHLRVHNG